MSKINDGGPAYPLQSIGPDFAPGYSGMSLRDAVAIAALHGLIASGTFTNSGPGFGDFIVSKSMDIADAFIAARTKGGDADG